MVCEDLDLDGMKWVGEVEMCVCVCVCVYQEWSVCWCINGKYPRMMWPNDLKKSVAGAMAVMTAIIVNSL
jgi:hypothetical protein